MSYLDQEWYCKGCSFQDRLGNLPDPHTDINPCPKCKEKGEFNLMMTVEKYREEQRKEELRGQIYCRDCGHIGPVESFPLDAPGYKDCGERRCPQCGSDNGINASLVRFCSKCNERPAVEEEGTSQFWCQECKDEFDKEFEFADQAWQDGEYFD